MTVLIQDKVYTDNNGPLNWADLWLNFSFAGLVEDSNGQECLDICAYWLVWIKKLTVVFILGQW